MFARSLCRVAWVVPKIPEGSISDVIGREVCEEGEAPRALIKQEQDPPTNVGEFSRSNQKPHSGHPPSARSAIEVIIIIIAASIWGPASVCLHVPASLAMALQHVGRRIQRVASQAAWPLQFPLVLCSIVFNKNIFSF